MRPAPTVSVITATYNRSRVLGHAIRSVVGSTFADWELIVVGDHCTDDTEACVASFGDERIRFVNLPSNCGDQSGPNNHGIGLARGRYIAFLNHDDFHLPHHLATCAAELDAGTAELVWVPAAIAGGSGAPAREGLPCGFSLTGLPTANGYTPFSFNSASSWMFRRELTEKVGPWPSADRVYVTPSQAWLFRASRAGVSMKFIPKIGVILVWSGTRRGSYAQSDSPDHERLAQWLREDPRFPERLLEDAAMTTMTQLMSGVHDAPWKAILRACLRPAYALQTAAGIHPESLYMVIRYGRRGGFIRHHRRFTGAR